MILDESLTDLDALLVARAAGALDCAMSDLSRFGRISSTLDWPVPYASSGACGDDGGIPAGAMW